MEVLNGFEISNMEATSVSVGESTRQNSSGVKSKFVVLGMKMYLVINGRKRYFGGNVRQVLFEDELPGTALTTLRKYIAKDASGGMLKDQKGGIVIDLQELKKHAEDYDLCEQFLDWPGGAVETYKLKKGACYANDRDGVRSTFNGAPVVRDSIDVFVQVVQYVDGKPKYAPGMSLEGRGQRLENRFWRVPVNEQQPQAAETVFLTPRPTTSATTPETPVVVPEVTPAVTTPVDTNTPPF